MKGAGKISVRPSTSLRYAQDERFSCPFVLSVTRRVKSKHERRSPGTFHLGNLYTPGLEALGHPLTVHGCSQAVPTGTEVGTLGAMDRKKALRLGGRFEAAHAALPLACWLVGVPRAVIKIAVLAMFYPREDLSLGGSVALEFVSNDHARHIPQSPTQPAEELLCCFLIPAALHQDIQHVPVLIYRQPQRVPFSLDRQKYFIHLPLVPKPGTATPKLRRILLAKLPTSFPNRFISHAHATFT
jgi:hypothetical protein